jgi:hypothetical protein
LMQKKKEKKSWQTSQAHSSEGIIEIPCYKKN